jgi:hypothetical protein
VTSHETKHILGRLALSSVAAANGALLDATCGKATSRTASPALAVVPLALLVAAWAVMPQIGALSAPLVRRTYSAMILPASTVEGSLPSSHFTVYVVPSTLLTSPG